MKTRKRRANPLRRAYHDIIRDEIKARPRCALVHTIGADEDGFTYIHFSCLNHDATWRYLIEVHLNATPATGQKLASPCPPHGALDTQEHQARPQEEAEAEALICDDDMLVP